MFYIIWQFSTCIAITIIPHRAGRNGSCTEMESTLSFLNKFTSALVRLVNTSVSVTGDERLCVLC